MVYDLGGNRIQNSIIGGLIGSVILVFWADHMAYWVLQPLPAITWLVINPVIAVQFFLYTGLFITAVETVRHAGLTR